MSPSECQALSEELYLLERGWRGLSSGIAWLAPRGGWRSWRSRGVAVDVARQGHDS